MHEHINNLLVKVVGVWNNNTNMRENINHETSGQQNWFWLLNSKI